MWGCPVPILVPVHVKSVPRCFLGTGKMWKKTIVGSYGSLHGYLHPQFYFGCFVKMPVTHAVAKQSFQERDAKKNWQKILTTDCGGTNEFGFHPD